LAADPVTASGVLASFAATPWVYVLDGILAAATMGLAVALARRVLDRSPGGFGVVALLAANDDRAPLRRLDQLGASLDLDEVL
jgi:hypothetical protein